MKRKVLMISHGYPPVGGSGMLRILKFSHYLPEHGWQPVVLTLRRTNHPRLDPRLQTEVPAGTAIYRSPVWNPIAMIVALRDFLFGKKEAPEEPLTELPSGKGESLASDGAPGSSDGGGDPVPAKDKPRSGGGIASLIKDLLTTPDSYSGWFLPGVFMGFAALVRHQPTVIYSTSPPPTAHLIGWTLSRISGIPWVVDFRDPWTLQFKPGELETRKGRWCRRLERAILKGADRIIANTEPLAAALIETYPHLPPGKFTVITNGFDPADFKDEPGPPPADGPFVFTHTGEFFPGGDLRVPDPFLLALGNLLDSGRLSPDSVRLRLVGSGEYTDLPQFKRFMASPLLGKCIEVIDFVPHGEIPGQMASAHALLLFQNSPIFRMQVPAKAFEYIRASRPILAIAAPGATSDLIDSVRHGDSIRPEDIEGLERAIIHLIDQRGEAHDRDQEELSRFTRPGLTARLAGLLDGMIGRERSGIKTETGSKPDLEGGS
jgi:glycosyltransferase involved in cell wall biosynthesis